jgi:hypothetical protein
MNGKNGTGKSGLGIWKLKSIKRKIFAIAVLHTFEMYKDTTTVEKFVSVDEEIQTKTFRKRN